MMEKYIDMRKKRNIRRGAWIWRMIVLSFILYPLSFSEAHAQVKVGLRGGLDVSEMSFSNDVFKKSNRMGFFVGPVVKFTVPVVGLSFDVSGLYAKRNAEIRDIYMSAEADQPEKLKFSDKMVLVPIHVRYGITFGEGGVFAFAGPQFGFNINGEDEQTLREEVASWRSRDSELSFDLGGGLTLGKLEFTVCYNVPLGKAGEVKVKSAADEVFKGTYKTWKISAAYFF